MVPFEFTQRELDLNKYQLVLPVNVTAINRKLFLVHKMQGNRKGFVKNVCFNENLVCIRIHTVIVKMID